MSQSPARAARHLAQGAGRVAGVIRRRNEGPSDPPLVADLLAERHFQDGIKTLAASTGRSESDVLAEATDDLRGMSATHDQAVTQWWDRLGHWMLRGFDLIVDEEGLAGLRTLGRSHSLVFLISHKSYLDEWIVPPTLSRFGMSPPFGLAGSNLDFFPLGTIARRTGIIHIRRATGDLPVYKFALRSFMGHLVGRHAHLIWSIEGGRSRTGKLRPPRFGLLRYVVDAVDQFDTDEVYLVPVSIVYDQLPRHEVQLMTSEAKGLGKTPENVSWFAGYLRGLAERLGRVYVDFGDPLPLRARLGELRAQDGELRTAVERVAVEVCHRINMATPVTPTAAVTIAMLGADRALTLDDIVETVRPLADYLQARNWPTAGAADLHDRATLRRAMQDLVTSGVLTTYTGTTTVWGITPGEELTAAIYRNTAIHTLVNRAIVEVVLSRIADGVRPGREQAWQEVLDLRELLKFEFFFAPRADFAKELQDELTLMDPGGEPIVAPSAEDAQRYLDLARPLVAHLVLRPFIDSYWILASVLAGQGAASVTEEKAVLDECRKVGQQWVLQRRVASAESISGEMFATAWRLAVHRGLAGADAVAAGVADRRQDFLAEITAVRKRIGLIAERARADAERATVP